MVAGEGKGACPNQCSPSSAQSEQLLVVPMTFSLRTQPRTTSLPPPIILTLNIEPRTPTITHRASNEVETAVVRTSRSHLPNYIKTPKPLLAMRFATAVIAFLSAGLAPTGASVLVQRDQSVIVNDDLKVPGDSPLELCPKSHDEDIVTIDSVDLSPNPPQAGKELVIKASGTVKQNIEKGAYVLLQVKYGLIRLISTKADLCEQIENVDLECPIEKGVLTVTKSVELPNEIPSGKYTVFADVYTADDVPITCLTAQVVFSRNTKSFFSLEL
ncbi:ML domain-containing protein [Colletotrichum salicis]|uniref:Phosphatidylglycerol/phosphatidylinositol transfer protein n=1 Tax=Colletotrichum salicis TaxID=1209931 RepID=A0A135T6R2_9PEZI|nr:ML domain-containing protein [Colletotrichum salicis]